MSSRAIRRLREEQKKEFAIDKNDREDVIKEDEDDDDDSDEEYSEEEEVPIKNSFAAAAFSQFDDSSSSEDEDEVSDDDGEHDKPNIVINKNDNSKQKKSSSLNNDDDGKKDEEDEFDAILQEFNPTSSTNGPNNDAPQSFPQKKRSASQILLSNIDLRNLDIDHAMRNLLGGQDGRIDAEFVDHENANQMLELQQQEQQQQQGGQGGQRVNRRQQRAQKRLQQKMARQQQQRKGSNRMLFGKTQADWTKPPTFMGGGMGMQSYSSKRGKHSNAKFAKFIYSDTYRSALSTFDTTIVNSGDVNALAMFVADNPYCVEAVLQLSMVLFHTPNNMERGTSLLRRAMFVYESAFLGSFLKQQQQDDNEMDCFEMDISLDENTTFFTSLFRLMQIACMMGCMDSCCAFARIILSFDANVDPMGVLLVLDYYALATMNIDNTQFIIDLVESDEAIHISWNPTTEKYDDDKEEEEKGEKQQYICPLVDMPNWAYSYALALRRMSQEEIDDNDGDYLGDDVEDEDLKNKLDRQADIALQEALRKYPSVLPLLLEQNKIDTKGRSCLLDWPSILDHYNTSIAMVSPSEKFIIGIFVKRHFRLWKPDDVVSWLYRNAVIVAKENDENGIASLKKNDASTAPEESGIASATASVEDDNAMMGISKNISLSSSSSQEQHQQVAMGNKEALNRYLRCNADDFTSDTFQMLPAGANPLDPRLVVPALEANHPGMGGRRRMIQQQQVRQQQLQAGGGGMHDNDLERILMEQLGIGGDGNGGRVEIDPDSPLVEVFLRSMMPWTRVEGVPRI